MGLTETNFGFQEQPKPPVLNLNPDRRQAVVAGSEKLL